MTEQTQTAETPTPRTRRKKVAAKKKAASAGSRTRKKMPASKKAGANGKARARKKMPMTATQEKKAVAQAKAAEAQRRKDAEAAAKEKHRREVERSLAKTAKEINARFEAIARSEQRTDDQRLSCAIELAIAKEHCRDIGIKFQQWCDDNIKQKYDTARKLLAIGVAEREEEGAGKKLLEDMRDKNRAANKAMRDRKKKEQRRLTAEQQRAADAVRSHPTNERSGETQDDVELPAMDAAKAAIDRMDEGERATLLREQAETYGARIVYGEPEPEKTAEPEPEEESSALTPRQITVRAFGRLRAKGKIEFVKWACGEVGGRLVMDES